jgi:hypothetical protein
MSVLCSEGFEFRGIPLKNPREFKNIASTSENFNAVIYKQEMCSDSKLSFKSEAAPQCRHSLMSSAAVHSKTLFQTKYRFDLHKHLASLPLKFLNSLLPLFLPPSHLNPTLVVTIYHCRSIGISKMFGGAARHPRRPATLPLQLQRRCSCGWRGRGSLAGMLLLRWVRS